MMLLKKIPFFLFLLVLFFCLHGSVENYGYVEFSEVLLVGAEMLIGTALFFALVFLVVKNYILASLITCITGLWYFFFGAIIDWIKTFAAASIFSRYSVLLPLLIGITILLALFLKRRKTFSLKLFFYLNLLFLIYCLIDGTLLISKQFTPEKKTEKPVAFDIEKVTARPNVYYLVFDGYAGYKSLKDSFAFANDSLYSFLNKKDFSILPVHSNYDLTLFSMSSVLNMRYVDSGYNPAEITQRDLQLRTNEIKLAEVFSIFNKMGYRFNNYSIFDVNKQHAIARQNSFLPVHSVLLTDKILHNRIIRTAGFLFNDGKLVLPSRRKNYIFQHDTNNLFSQKMISKAAKEKGQTPIFSFAHFLMPHWPYYRDSTGNYNHANIFTNNSFDGNKQFYISYLKYTNSVIQSLITDITDNDPGAIIVMMSDHGFRNYNINKPFEPYYFDILCAVRFPDKNYPVHKEQWSAVNMFRYLFNCEYSQHIPYLPDTTILLSNSVIHF